MNKEEQMIYSHLLDLAEACDRRGYPMGSDFLTLNEQNLFLAFSKDKLPPVSMEMCGGYELAERKIIFYKPVGVGEEYPAPISLLSVQPLMKKFSEELTHRDYLGALMNLGISRTKTGDIIVQDKQAYLIVSESIADYICENLTRIRHTSVMCRQIDWQEFDYKPQVKEVMGSIASVRLDAVIGLAFSQSRSKLTGYISEEKVQVNGKVITSNAYNLKENDLISVRGLGKFRYKGTSAVTKKGRLMASVEVFV